jgi:hypothetical protein
MLQPPLWRDRDDLDLLAAYEAATDKDVFLARLDQKDQERDAKLASPTALANYALYYASLGVDIFPLAPGTKDQPLGKWKDIATSDVDTVRAWWTKTPQANIGIPTGRTFDVIDFDGSDGFESMLEMQERLVGEMLAMSVTGRGRHIILPVIGIKNSAGKLGAGTDTRGTNGYIVAPPSRHPNGSIYRWSSTPTRLIEHWQALKVVA